MVEGRLSQEVRARASVSPWGEYAWRRDDFEAAVKDAQRAGLACLGGQVQFQFPDGVCEPYWLSYDSEERRPGESWEGYVERCAGEVIGAFRKLCEETDFRAEAQRWEFISDRMKKEGIDPLDHLWFVIYLGAEG